MRLSFPVGAANAFIDSAPESERSAFVSCYARSLEPRTEPEFTLATAIAEARWRLARLWKLEASVVNAEIARAKTLHPAWHSTPIIARALSSIADSRRMLDVIDFLELRYHRQYIRAHARLQRLRRKAAQQSKFSKGTQPKSGNLRNPSPVAARPGPATDGRQLPIIELSKHIKDSCDR